MNFALSQRQTDRHPVGLLVVVGLHVLLAAVLVSARLARPAVEPTPAVLTPLDPVKPPEHKEEQLPDASKPTLRTLVVDPPIIPVEPQSDTIVAPPDDHVEKTGPTLVVDVGTPADDSVHNPRVTPRAARIDAGAAQCRPDYPAAAQRAGITGVTRIRFSVDASGRIAGSAIVKPSGALRENRLMDKAAAEALAQCPVQVGTDEMGRPVGTTTDVDYVWNLN